MLSYSNFSKYAGTNFQQRKFVEGYRVYDTKDYIFQIGKFGTDCDNNLKIKALCLKTGKLCDGFYQVDGLFTPDGEIIKFDCQCPAGNSHQCKHIIGCLFYCMYNLNVGQISCTDSPQVWNKKYKEALQNYKPVSLDLHPCFSESPPENENKLRTLMLENKQKEALKDSTNKQNTQSSEKNHIKLKNNARVIKRVKPREKLSEEKNVAITALFSKILKSGIQKAVIGHHKPKKYTDTKVTDRDKEIYNLIIQNQDSELMEMISLLKVTSFKDCCQNVLDSLSVDAVKLCESTRNWFAQWSKERKFRITASICYNLKTYTENVNADWKFKSNQFINPKGFKVEACEYGKQFEKQAREVFKTSYPNLEVIETGLIISQVNPWLAASPDGVILENGKLISLLEIKCPTDGRTKNIDATVDNQINGKQGCLVKQGEEIAMRKKHKYFGQVQLGMAVLNVDTCHFVIHSTCDKKIHVILVKKDITFLSDMMKKLKLLYFSVLLPEICLHVHPTGSTHADGQHYNYFPKKQKKTKTQKRQKKKKEGIQPNDS